MGRHRRRRQPSEHAPWILSASCHTSSRRKGKEGSEKAYDESPHVLRRAQRERDTSGHRNAYVEDKKRQRHRASRAVDESKGAQRDTEDIREEAEVRPTVCWDQVDQREVSRPRASITDRRCSEADAECVRCEEKQLSENICSRPRPDEAAASDDLRVGKVPKR